MVEQTANGHDNVLVTVDGNKNTVAITLGRATLTLDLAHKRRAAVTSELGLLRTEARSTTLVGRDADLERFRRWLASPAAIAVECVIGRGGAGKTRFGIELCERAEADGWTAGFVTADRLTGFHAAGGLSDWCWKGPTLLIIDYAAARTAILREWLDELARRPASDAKQHPLRILLLERHADREIGWWSDLSRQGGLSGPRGDSFLDGVVPYVLPTLTDLEERRRLMAQVMKQAAIVKAIYPASRPPEPGADPVFDRALSADGLDNEPLYLMMAAIVALDVGVSSALSQSRTALAHAIACHENERLEKIAKVHGVDPQLFSHLAACVTLQGGCDREEAERLVDQERTINPLWTNVSPENIAEWLADGLPGLNGGVNAVRPDLIGGAFLLLVLRWKRRSLAKQLAIFERVWERVGVTVAQIIIRTAVDHAGHDRKHDSLNWLHHLIGRTESDDALAAIADAIPEKTIALQDCACAVLERLVAIWRLDMGDNPGKIAVLARILNNLAVRLSDSGNPVRALPIAQEVVDHYRQLANQRPDVFTSDLAMSLNNLANRQGDLGRREEALNTILQAITLYRQLVKHQPDAFISHLAGSLNNLANYLGDLSRREEALDAALEAVTLYRQFDKQQSVAPNLAMSLITLANTLSALGRREGALDAVTQAVTLRRRLAKQQPDAFIPDLALGLNNLANVLSALGRREEALDAATQAVTLRRQLAQHRPEAYTPGLAMSLNNLANALSALGRREEALDAATQAVTLRRQLAEQKPNAFIPDLAMSLNNLTKFLSELGRWEEALDAATQAVTLRRQLAEHQSEAFTPDLAMSLNNLANVLSALGRREEALDALNKALDCFRQLAQQWPDVFTPDLAMNLSNLANVLSASGRWEEALDAVTQAVVLRRQLAQQRPDAFTPYLARSLAILANCKDSLGDGAAALEADREAITMLSVDFLQFPQAFSHWMRLMVAQYVGRCQRLEQASDKELLMPILEVFERSQDKLEEPEA